jgi:hypothetical protein
MDAKVRRISYFYCTVADRPGEAYGLLNQLAGERVNLLAFGCVPMGPENTQLTLFPESVEELARAAEKTGLTLAGPQHAFIVQGDDHLGALLELHRRLADANISIYASNGVTDGQGRYGYVFYVKSVDFERAAQVLGV